MSCFDSSTLQYYTRHASPTPTYHSYLCRSRDCYSARYNEKHFSRANYNNMWGNISREKVVRHNPSHISKLRSILSETISDITKGDQLQKGDSVELTLEIEIMKTETASPSNSLVEVTIIQHNKDENMRNFGNNNKIIANKMPLHLEANSSISETASEKRRNWFKRVISWQKYGNTPDLNKRKKDGLNYSLKSHKVSKRNLTVDQPRNNFIKVLPEEIKICNDFTKGYRRVSPIKKTPMRVESSLKLQKDLTVLGKDSVIRKLSNIFLPAQKINQNKPESVQSAYKRVNKDIQSTILVNNEKSHQTNDTEDPSKAYKLVKHDQNHLIDTKNKNKRKTKFKNNSLPGYCKRFFEPITRQRSKTLEPKVSYKNKVVRSHSASCCLLQDSGISDLKIKSSKSIADCRAPSELQYSTEILHKGDSAEISDRKKSKNRRKRHKRGETDYTRTKSKERSNRKMIHKLKKEKHSNNSLLEWNGQSIKLNRDIKKRIEKLIVNELENLALKEGMEYDVAPLPPTESTSTNTNNIEKVSSFICEIDLSEKKRPSKVVKKLKSHINKKETNNSSLSTLKKTFSSLKQSKERKIKPHERTETPTKERETFNTTNHVENSNENLPQHNFSEQQTETGNDQNNLEITYMNTNINNWSTESTNFKFENVVTKKLALNKENHESTNFKCPEEFECYQKAVASGFVKKIDSKDSMWNERATGTNVSGRKSSRRLVSVKSTRSTMKFSSSTSNENQSNIEIELNIKDLEMIINQAKKMQKAEKVLISAKRKRSKRQKKNVKFTGKNSPSYTNQVLANAAEKLEKYVTTKKALEECSRLKKRH